MANGNAIETTDLSLKDILNLPLAEKERLGLLHTPVEITQQPATWRETVGIIRGNSSNIGRFLQKSGIGTQSTEQVAVTLIGAGTSDYIGRTLVPLLRKEWKCQVNAVPSTSLFTDMDEFLQGFPDDTSHLWVSFSRSGDSYEGVGVLKKALADHPRLRHLVITCNADGKMRNICLENPRNSHCITLGERTNDQGLAMTSSFTNMIVSGHCLAHLDALERYEQILEELATAAESKMHEAAKLAHKLAGGGFSRICFLGDGALKGACKESALKVMELTAGHYSVMHETFLGLRHGPLSWLNNETLVVALLSNNPEKLEVETGLLRELESKKAAGALLSISPGKTTSVPSDYQLNWGMNQLPDDNYCPPLDTIFAQFFGLFSSLNCGLKPDMPSSDGKIRRVVSHF